MNSQSVLETLVSLTAQVTLLIGLTAWLTRKQLVNADADSCWASLHVCILLLTSAAFLLPHLRLVTWADFEPSTSHPIAEVVCAVAGRVFAWVWLSGTSVLVALGIGGMIRATLLVRRARIDEYMRYVLQTAVPALATASEPIDVRVSTENVSPFCWQIHQPVIILPAVVQHFPATEQAAIVRHELAHLRLQHPLQLFLQRLVEALYWFHPLVWWASRQAAAAREFRCDRESINSRPEVAAYLRSLLRLIESQLSAAERLPAGLGFMGDASLLSRRVRVLAECLDRSPKPAKVRRAALALFVAGAVCSVVWLPINPNASRRADWSPWPTWSAHILDATGIAVRDYEVDGHRLSEHLHGE